MTTLYGLSPIADRYAQVLILGSFPSVASLNQKQYYANPQNYFWRVIENLFLIPSSDPYPQRCRKLQAYKVALWDVIGSCQRQGSLDSKIRMPDPNDFAKFYNDHPQITAVFWNGAMAEHQYGILVGAAIKPTGCDEFSSIRLPSTSPANARISLSSKIEQWKLVLSKLQNMQ